MLPRVIAIDGPAGSGKSTVSLAVAKALGYLFVDTGAFYRAVTLAALQKLGSAVGTADEPTLVEIATHAHLDISKAPPEDSRHFSILLNGQDVSHEVRDQEVEKHVSRISAMPAIREVLNHKYRQLAARQQVIMAGRDIGTVVLPDADLKIYLDASAKDRAQRRFDQRIVEGQSANFDEILAALIERDTLDSQRSTAPLRRAEDAVYVNTDNLDISSAITHIKDLVLSWKPR